MRWGYRHTSWNDVFIKMFYTTVSGNFFLDGSCNVDHTAHVSVHGTTLQRFRVDGDVSIPVLSMQDAHIWRLTLFLEIRNL